MKTEWAEPGPATGHPLAAALRAYDGAFVRGRYPRPATLASVLDAARGLPAADAETIDRLERENARLGHPDARGAVAALRRGAAVVVTGQQPGLFGGTLLTFEKAAAAATIAAAATAAGRPCVGVFWAQSEDHDLDEVNRYEAERDGAFVRESAPIPDEGRRLGDVVLDAAAVAWSEERLRAAGAGEEAATLLAPRLGERFSEWTLRVVARLLGPAGLIVADPRWFHDRLGPFVRRAILEADAWSAAFRADTERVRAAGFEPQVAAGAPGGLFLVDEAGRRRRLSAGDPWTLDDGRTFARDALLALAESDPGRFSPNVQLRPLTQQVLLPVAAQVGGPAEVAYFAQFPALFEAAGLPLPVMIPRPSSTVLGVKEAKLREALGLDATRLLDDPATWPEGAPTDAAVEDLFARVAAAEEAAWAPLDAAAVEEPIRRAVESHRTQGRRQLEKLKDTFRRDAERRAGVEGGRRRRLAEWVRPKGRPQERVLALPHLVGRASLAAIARWTAALDPFATRRLVATFEPEDRP